MSNQPAIKVHVLMISMIIAIVMIRMITIGKNMMIRVITMGIMIKIITILTMIRTARLNYYVSSRLIIRVQLLMKIQPKCGRWGNSKKFVSEDLQQRPFNQAIIISLDY